MTTAALTVSVLDLIPVRRGQTTAQAIAAARRLIRAAEEAGAHRFWVAEHHNAASVASTSPAVLIALLAAETERIRVGSGGVMLPNHAPLAVAEQFAALEAAYPDRIDLGIGRAPGTDPVTSWTLRNGASDDEIVRRFPAYVEQVIAFMSPGGARLEIGGRPFDIVATPHAVAAPPVWLLGSSDYSARLAAQLGLPYVFAHHFSGQGTAAALELYRQGWAGEGQPRTFLTVNVVTAETDEEAWALARPYQLQMAGLRTGQPLRELHTVESAREQNPPTDEGLALLSRSWLVGTPDRVAEQVRALAQQFEVDEVMLHPIAGSFADERLDRSVHREQAVVELTRRLTTAAG
ncbi:MAG: LLM class flavin-dependent oxidoreductase [Propionibacteriaceae bacterium]|nr:LLM class flavin-dependent oxidoreductase [Propionibacteriaceae bacterium]